MRVGATAIIVFWSAGCESSLERLRQLATWHATRADESAPIEILTVHSPRFPGDEDAEQAALTMARTHIPFPAVHDPDFKTWSRYNPEGWPATVVVDDGSVVGIDHGLAPLSAALSQLEEQTGQEPVTELDLPAPYGNPAHPPHQGNGLCFPQAVAVDDERMLIADTGNNRVLSGRIRPELSVFMVDGIYEGVRRPTAVARWGPNGIVVVEDNRQLTVIDHDTGAPKVLSDQFVRAGGLCVDADGSLVITDAAANRLFRMVEADSDGSSTRWLPLPIAGSGFLGVRAGRADTAQFAQPVAVARSHRGLVVADAASSGIRLLTDSGKVMNITSGDLYNFGLVDGAAHRALLERPSGLCVLPGGNVVIADSGNHHLRLLNGRRIETLPIQGLRYPMGVASVDREWIAVADTHNHRVVLANPHRNVVRELRLGGLVGSARPTDIGVSRQSDLLVGA